MYFDQNVLCWKVIFIKWFHSIGIGKNVFSVSNLLRLFIKNFVYALKELYIPYLINSMCLKSLFFLWLFVYMQLEWESIKKGCLKSWCVIGWKKALSESHRSIWAGQWDFHDTCYFVIKKSISPSSFSVFWNMRTLLEFVMQFIK